MKPVGGAAVTGDLYGISERLTELDPGYFVVRKGSAYEVHHAGGGSREGRGQSTYCLSLPFPELDARTVDYVRKTRAERAAAVFAELEAANERRRKLEVSRSAEQAAEAIGRSGGFK